MARRRSPAFKALLGVAAAASLGSGAAASDQRPGLQPCRLPGVEHQALCGSVRRPLDPAEPQGRQIDVHYALLPALARNRRPDPVFFFAGGPGQSAIDLAGHVGRLLARLGNRRDIVLIDQRGSGRSAPLRCAEVPPTQPLALTADPVQQLARLRECRIGLQALPHGDLRHYSTWIAIQDADAVRQALGAAQVNLVGASYGSRAALDFMRQFPQAVRRVVIDGVAPPDMALPAAASGDNQAALEAVFSSCDADAACRARHPALRQDWQSLLSSLPRQVSVLHPVTGQPETLSAGRDLVLALLRTPLYSPPLAAALPHAIVEAARGRFAPLIGLASALSSARSGRLAEGMHFSVVCSEDLPRLAPGIDVPAPDFGDSFAVQYTRVCADWPRGAVPAAFYTLPPAPAATLLLSGGADPATPPRHGQRVALALGAKARHVVVAQAGHGLIALPCLRDVLFRFIDAPSDQAALEVDADCARALPRPAPFAPPAGAGAS